MKCDVCGTECVICDKCLAEEQAHSVPDAEVESLKRMVRNGFDVDRVVEWLYSKPRKPASIAFTAGGERQAAYLCEMAESAFQSRIAAMNHGH